VSRRHAPRCASGSRRSRGAAWWGFDEAPAAHFWAGLRTFAADDGFAVGPDPEVPGLWWSAGLGGHGMSASIGVGQLAAARLLETPHDAEVARALDPGRLAALDRA